MEPFNGDKIVYQCMHASISMKSRECCACPNKTSIHDREEEAQASASTSWINYRWNIFERLHPNYQFLPRFWNLVDEIWGYGPQTHMHLSHLKELGVDPWSLSPWFHVKCFWLGDCPLTLNTKSLHRGQLSSSILISTRNILSLILSFCDFSFVCIVKFELILLCDAKNIKYRAMCCAHGIKLFNQLVVAQGTDSMPWVIFYFY